jgi:hypothetical protein
MTCKPVTAAVWPSKPPDAVLDYGVNFERECARQWLPMTDYSLTQHIRIFDAGKPSGFQYQPTTAGRTGSSRPAFPSSLGATVADGSVVWTCVPLSTASLIRTLSGVPVWTCEDSGIVIGSQSVIEFIGRTTLGSGADGTDYVVKIVGPTSDGLSIVQYAVLPVRIPKNPETVCA